MDAGRMVEFDHPHMLLQNADGILRGMVDQTGRGMAETLSRVAKQVATCFFTHYTVFLPSIIN